MLGLQRYRLWDSERITLTSKRIVHSYGVLETTRTEASLRLDRVSGLQIVETLPGRIFNYGTIVVEAPGNHPALHQLFRISRAEPFYLRLREVVFGEDWPQDPELTGSRVDDTQPLPVVDADAPDDAAGRAHPDQQPEPRSPRLPGPRLPFDPGEAGPRPRRRARSDRHADDGWYQGADGSWYYSSEHPRPPG